MSTIIKEIPGFYQIIALNPFRETEGVSFKTIPPSHMPNISSLDIVKHEKEAVSPAKISHVERPWYMHPYQDDNLIVLQGTRTVEIYKEGFDELITITVEKDKVYIDNELVYDKPAMLVWFKEVFHRVHSGVEGSTSINLAVHYKGYDLKSNFNIYDLDTKKSTYKIVRAGDLDQF